MLVNSLLMLFHAAFEEHNEYPIYARLNQNIMLLTDTPDQLFGIQMPPYAQPKA